MKFKLDTLKSSGKDFMNNAKAPAMMGALIVGGAIGSQKFLNVETWMKNADPNAFYVKHQGGIKALVGIATLAAWKNCPDWAKWLIMGVIVQGLIQETRTLAGDNANIPAIGNADEIARKAAEELFKGSRLINGVMDNNETSVGNMDLSQRIDQDANTMVAGVPQWGSWGKPSLYAA